MRKIALAVVLLAACAPRGYYVSNVYTVNGSLLQEKCEISFNGRPNPDACHVEPVMQMRGQYDYPQNMYQGPGGPQLQPPAPAPPQQPQ